MCLRVQLHACHSVPVEVWRQFHRSWFSPATLWGPGIQLSFPSYKASAFHPLSRLAGPDGLFRHSHPSDVCSPHGTDKPVGTQPVHGLVRHRHPNDACILHGIDKLVSTQPVHGLVVGKMMWLQGVSIALWTQL